MLKEIIEKYEHFSDALILEFTYKNSSENTIRPMVEITLRCMNARENYAWEMIILRFEQVVKIKFQEDRSSSTVIYSALLKKSENIIKVDFFPLIGSEPLMEDPNSNFYIHCKEISYKLIEKSPLPEA